MIDFLENIVIITLVLCIFYGFGVNEGKEDEK